MWYEAKAKLKKINIANALSCSFPSSQISWTNALSCSSPSSQIPWTNALSCSSPSSQIPWTPNHNNSTASLSSLLFLVQLAEEGRMKHLTLHTSKISTDDRQSNTARHVVKNLHWWQTIKHSTSCSQKYPLMTEDQTRHVRSIKEQNVKSRYNIESQPRNSKSSVYSRKGENSPGLLQGSNIQCWFWMKMLPSYTRTFHCTCTLLLLWSRMHHGGWPVERAP